MAHDASNNNPKKEIMVALVGITMFLVMVLSIATFGWLRPAGNHDTPTEPATKHGKEYQQVMQTLEAKPETAQSAKESDEAQGETAPTQEKTETQEKTDEVPVNKPDGTDAHTDTQATATPEADAKQQIKDSNGDTPVAPTGKKGSQQETMAPQAKDADGK